MGILNDNERMRAKHHLGYINATAAQAFSFGIIAQLEVQSQCEAALDNLLPVALPKFQQLLCALDKIECTVFGTTDLAQIESVAEIKVNREMLKELRERYRLAQESLANMIGTIPNVWDQRSWLMVGGGGINVPVFG